MLQDPQLLNLLGSVLWGASLGLAGLFLLGFLVDPPPIPPERSSFEQTRRRKLRELNSWFRLFEPAIDRLAASNRRRNSQSMDRIGTLLQQGNVKIPYLPEEYWAIHQLQCLLLGLGVTLGLGLLLDNWVLAAIVGIGLALVVFSLGGGAINTLAQQRRQTLKQRLPYTIDLIALLLEAGASFQEAVTTIVRENPNHPLSEEFGFVLREISLGRTRQQALLAMQTRLNDDDIGEIIFAIVKGEELGTPLSQILRTQADQLRLKRSQWAEKASGEAQVNIVLPGMLIMIACLIIVVAPFILGTLYSSTQP